MSDTDMSEDKKKSLAVALEYEHGGVPRVTAKGRGPIADKIVELAREHNVPIDENETLAEALSQVELEQEIPVELYRAVAVVISFALHVSGKLPKPPASAQKPPPVRPVPG